jgi:hypothetical protein
MAHRRNSSTVPVVAVSLVGAVLVFIGCAQKPVTVRDELPPPRPAIQKPLPPIGYAIQVGAFSHLDNAVRLTDELQRQGLNAYYFVHPDGLYKVRFGTYPSRETARGSAVDLVGRGLVDDFYIVGPNDYPRFREGVERRTRIRYDIIRTAKTFLGVPYRWGGTSAAEGFDCSGLTMAVYHLNGFDLPRSSTAQWGRGMPVSYDSLEQGDLVFFATRGGNRVSHVGIYVGDRRFIHAPGRGKRIRIDSMSRGYFRRHFVGARTYL